MRRPTVLVVDDDAISRTVVSKKLKSLAEVVEAEDGQEALNCLQGIRFDLAIIDLEMPRLSGIELIQRMRSMPNFKHIPIIVLTANETRGGLESALMGGATSFLLKPLNWSAFGEHIRHVLELAYRAGHMAMHDHLTGLPNRTFLNERLEAALANVQPHSLVATHMLDLDQFKNVNDTMGHPAGDKLLQLVAERLRGLVRATDMVARMGGDEFAIVQTGIFSPAEAAALAERIVEVVSLPYDLMGREVRIGTTVGISIASKVGSIPEQEMRSADVALYRAKNSGRGTFCFFEQEMDLDLHTRSAMEADMRRAIEMREFELYYQPVVCLDTQRISSFEALIRWHHPSRGELQPTSFIPFAEETGLIIPIGDWVLNQACATATQWPAHLSVSVNISPAHLPKPGLVDSVRAALGASGLDPSRLELEIRETNLLRNGEVTLAALHRLRDLGVRVALDDFGTGYSSLTYLQSFPFDKIKIDPSFVVNAAGNSGSLNIVRAVAMLAKGLGMVSTAEGVETKEQLAAVRAEGCTQMQGYLSSRPLPEHEVALLLLEEQVNGKLIMPKDDSGHLAA